MEILVISSILPLPGIRDTNDFIYRTYSEYRKLFRDDGVTIITPLKYKLDPVRRLMGNTIVSRVGDSLSLEEKGFRVEVFPFVSAWRFRNLHAMVTRTVYLFNLKRIRRLFSEHDFRVIHARFIFPDGLLAFLLSRRYGIPYFINTHNERFYFEHAVSRRVAVRLLKKATLVLPLNHTNYLYYRTLGIRNIIRTTHGFDPGFIRKQKAVTGSAPSILTVADLIKLKNIDLVIRALQRLAGRYDFTYTIIGKGPEKEYLADLAESLRLSSRIIFRDPVPHEMIADEMYRHDIYVMPSYFETFGRVYFEVMAMGIPVICAKNSGIYGIFRDGEEGLSVDHRSMESLVAALELLISDPGERSRIGLNGQALVKNFTWEQIAGDLHEKYVEHTS